MALMSGPACFLAHLRVNISPALPHEHHLEKRWATADRQHSCGTACQRCPWHLLALGALGSSGSLTARTSARRDLGGRCSRVALRSSRAELLVDGDVHTMDEIREAIAYLEIGGRHVRTRFFCEPERADNKKWKEFFKDMNIEFQPVRRSADLLHEATDEAISRALTEASSLGFECVGLVTSDSDFIKTILEVERSGTSCFVFVPASKKSLVRAFEVGGVRTVRLQTNKEYNVGPKVRALLHEDGAGSVQLADPFLYSVSREVFDARLAVVKDFLDGLGYGREGHTIQSIAKFWYANCVGSLVVFPAALSLNAIEEVIGPDSRLSSWVHYTEFGQLAYFLPATLGGRKSKSNAQTYGNALSRSIFKGGGPFMLSDSPQMVAQALRRLGYLDDELNADLPEAMLCFVNASKNKTALRKQGFLPAQGATNSNIQAKLREAFLSTSFTGVWQVSKGDGAMQDIQRALQRAGVLAKTDSGYSKHETFEAMKLFSQTHGLPSMKTYNGIAWRVWDALRVSGTSPSRTADVKF